MKKSTICEIEGKAVRFLGGFAGGMGAGALILLGVSGMKEKKYVIGTAFIASGLYLFVDSSYDVTEKMIDKINEKYADALYEEGLV